MQAGVSPACIRIGRCSVAITCDKHAHSLAGKFLDAVLYICLKHQAPWIRLVVPERKPVRPVSCKCADIKLIQKNTSFRYFYMNAGWIYMSTDR